MRVAAPICGDFGIAIGQIDDVAGNVPRQQSDHHISGAMLCLRLG